MLKRLTMALALTAIPASAQAPESWLITVDMWGNPMYQLLTVKQDKARLEGDLDGDAVKGRRQGTVVEFTATDSNQAIYGYIGSLEQDTMRGTADFPDSNHPDRRMKHGFTARRIPQPSCGRTPPVRIRAHGLLQYLQSAPPPGTDDLARRHGPHQDHRFGWRG